MQFPVSYATATNTTSEDDGNLGYLRERVASRCPAYAQFPFPEQVVNRVVRQLLTRCRKGVARDDAVTIRDVYDNSDSRLQTDGVVARSSRSGQRWRLRNPWRRIAKLLMGLKPRPGRTTLTARIDNNPLP